MVCQRGRLLESFCGMLNWQTHDISFKFDVKTWCKTVRIYYYYSIMPTWICYLADWLLVSELLLLLHCFLCLGLVLTGTAGKVSCN